MKHATYNLFKQDKKVKQLERKKQRTNKQKSLVFWLNAEIVNQKD